MQRQAQRGTEDHSSIAESQLRYPFRQERPNTSSEWKPSILDIPQHCSDHHDSQPYPEQNEEASEITVITFRIEVRNTCGIVDGWEQAMLLLRSFLSSRGGYGDCRRRSIRRKGSRTAAVAL